MRNRFFSLFLIFFMFCSGIYILTFKQHDEFSVLENRDLSTMKILTFNSWMDTSFQDSVERTLADQFLLRNTLVKEYNKIQLNLNKLSKTIGKIVLKLDFQDKVEITMINDKVNLVRINGNERLVRCSKNIDNETKDGIIKNIDTINKYKEENGSVDFYGYFIISSHDSKEIYPDSNMEIFLNDFKQLNFPVDFFQFSNANEIEKYFFRTDHHWNHEGAYKGYKEIINLIYNGKEKALVPKDIHCFDDIKFYGSIARSAAFAYDIIPDNMCKMIFELPKYNLSINGEIKTEYGNFTNYLNGNVNNELGFDHYNQLYQSRRGIIKFETERSNLDNILIISDSLSNPIRDVLAAHFNKSIYINLDRYESEIGEFDLNNFIEKEDIDKVLILLSIENLLSEGEIRFLK